MTISYTRKLDLLKLLKENSYFLFGPRTSGKSYWIKKNCSECRVFDLLDSSTFTRFARNPSQLRLEIDELTKYVVIDEVQKLPMLLDEVHWLIENRNIHFLLTGSSPRKLKRSKNINLLAGRAWQMYFFPLCYPEIDDFDILKYFNRGGLPRSYLSKNYKKELKSYAELYLQQEIVEEGLTRNIQNFSRFLDIIALNNGKELHLSNLSNDSGVNISTIENYILILEDTLLGHKLLPFLKTKKRKAITRSKFYLFDIGVVNQLAHRGEIMEKSALFGECFEQWIIQEVRAYITYNELDLEFTYWRSPNGFEVDLIIGNKMAIEIKSTDQILERHLKGLRALKEENVIESFGVVSCDPIDRQTSDQISLFHWKSFLEKLWGGELV